MTQEKQAEIQALKARLDEVELEKKILDGQIRALAEDGGEDRLVEGPSTVGAYPGDDSEIVNGVFLGNHTETRDGHIDVYLRVVAARAGKLPLRGISPTSAQGETAGAALSLPRLFVRLDTDLIAPESVIAAALKAVRHGELSSFPARGVRGSDEHADAGEPRRVSVMEAAILRRSQILLGAPGSGKTSFVNLLAYALAKGDAQHLGGWPAAERDHLPVLVTLRDLATWVGARGGGHKAGTPMLWDFVFHDLRERNLGFVADTVHAAIERGEAVLLLDGLDDVPSRLVPAVRDSIQDCAKRYRTCRILVTCREMAYQQADLQLSGRHFPTTTLVPLDLQRIDHFVGVWHAESSPDHQAGRSQARDQADALRKAVRRSELRSMASNPMLLTVMALVHTIRGELPDSRARLYEGALDILLWHWEKGSEGDERRLTDLLCEAGRDRSDLVRMLEQLSYELCAGGEPTSGVVYEERGLIAGIGEQDLVTALRQLHPRKHLDWAQTVLYTLKLRAALLIEGQPGVFCYLHRTFQEYLAGAHLAHHLDFPKHAADLAPQWVAWSETILHAVGFLVHNQRELERPMLLVDRLCPASAPSDDRDWHRVWLAGEVLLEIGLSRVRDKRSSVRLLERVSHRLAALVEHGAMRARERARVGDVLGVLGDSRFDHSKFHMPAQFRGKKERASGLVAIKPGPFAMGSSERDPGRESDEIGNTSRLSIEYPFWTARYPVTVAEFSAFISAGGYDSTDWWTRLGLDWRRSGRRCEPDDWSEQAAFGNRPVVGVSWFEAMAYARWLDVQLRRRTRHVPDEYLMRLPTEAEWERVARGAAGRKYPWGDEWDEGRANVAGCIGRPVSVGLFPAGATPRGVQDMSGNVWEWSLSAYRPYPYKADDGRNDPGASGKRVLRGGSWLRDKPSARCARRLGAYPDRSHLDVGFRLVLSVEDVASS